ncbi:MAG: metallophosphoesterase [Vulcanimicrobiota bacterium]
MMIPGFGNKAFRITAAVLLLLFLIAGRAGSAGSGSFRFAVLSDSHIVSENSVYSLNSKTEQIVRKITSEVKPAFVIHCGDMISYTAAADSDTEILKMWDVFRKVMVERFLNNGIAFFPSKGNHDTAGKGKTLYAATWRNFTNNTVKLDSGEYTQSYAFHHGNSLFISLDRSSADQPEKDLIWLKGILMKSRGLFRHIFIFCHMGLLVSDESLSDSPRDRELETLLRDFKVDYFISGHYHMSFDTRIGPTTFIICGSAGEPWLSSFAVFTVEGDTVKFQQSDE